MRLLSQLHVPGPIGDEEFLVLGKFDIEMWQLEAACSAVTIILTTNPFTITYWFVVSMTDLALHRLELCTTEHTVLTDRLVFSAGCQAEL